MADPSRRLARFDANVRATGFAHVIGVDEVGRGSLAGPVVAAAVRFAADARIHGLDDSKKLAPEARTELAQAIRRKAVAFAFAFVGPRRIDEANIRIASLEAMRRSVRRAVVRTPAGDPAAAAAIVLVDGVDTIPGIDLPQQAVISGDAKSLAVAAASVVAKTVRDAFMARIAPEWPAYGFERNKGYGTGEHLAALRAQGPCPWHRYSYAPVSILELELEFS